MAKIIEYLNKENPTIKLINSCDTICSFCPNNQNGICKENEKVKSIDNRCLFEYGLKYGEELKWSELKELAFKKIIYKNRLSNVCKNCQWQCKIRTK